MRSYRDRPILTGRQLLASLLPLALAASPQEPSTREPQALEGITEKAEVRLVNLDVLVLDRKGQLVEALQASDFEILEDGRPVPIALFEAPVIAGKDPAPRPDSTQAAASLPPEGGPLLAFLLDQRGTTISAQRRALAILRDYVDIADPTARYALISLEDRPHVLIPPTTAAAELGAGIASFAMHPAGQRLGMERSATFSRIAEAYKACEDLRTCEPCVDMFELFVSYARDYGNVVEAEATRFLAGLSQAVGLLESDPGAKALVFWSETFSLRPGLEMFDYLAQVCPTRERDVHPMLLERNLVSEYGRVADLANWSRVTLFPIDAGGMHGFSASSVAFDEQRFVPSTHNDEVRIANLQSPLAFLADETGGKALFNGAEAEALPGLPGRLAGAYTLALSPPHPRSGRAHILEVRLRSKGNRSLSLSYRRGYFDKTLEQELADRLHGFLLGGLAEANKLQARATVVGEPVPDARGVPVRLSVEHGSIVRLAELGGAKRLRVWATALGGVKDRSIAIRQSFFDLTEEQRAGTAAWEVELRFDLGAGRWQIGLGVRDEDTGEIALLSTCVELAP